MISKGLQSSHNETDRLTDLNAVVGISALYAQMATYVTKPPVIKRGLVPTQALPCVRSLAITASQTGQGLILLQMGCIFQ